jgi:hypothetical protein
MHIVRDQIIDLVIGEISLLFPGIDQLFNVVVLIFKSQRGVPQILQFARGGACGNVFKGGNLG